MRPSLAKSKIEASELWISLLYSSIYSLFSVIFITFWKAFKQDEDVDDVDDDEAHLKDACCD